MESVARNVDRIPTPLLQARRRAERASTTTEQFDDWLLLGEVIRKHVATVLLAVFAAVDAQGSSRVESRLLGEGNWQRAISDAVQGVLRADTDEVVRNRVSEVNKKVPTGADWSAVERSTRLLSEALDLDDYPTPRSLSALLDFLGVVRNKTRGHGAKTADWKRSVVDDLSFLVDTALELVTSLDLYVAVQRETAGRRLVLCGDATTYVSTAAETELPVLVSFPGQAEDRSEVVVFGEVRTLLLCEVGNDRYFYFNGLNRSQSRAEYLDYSSGETRSEPTDPDWFDRASLPQSETAGARGLDASGESLHNLPRRMSMWVSRPALEERLNEVLDRPQTPVVSLLGPGGSGKTSLALNAAWHYAESGLGRFDLILWLSARDLDLLTTGVRETERDVTGLSDIAQAFCNLLEGLIDTSGEPIEVLRRELAAPTASYLIVLDNFETLDDPSQVQTFLVKNTMPPAKVLLTTRLRDFSADWHIEVGSLEPAEAIELLQRQARSHHVEGLVSDPKIQERLIRATQSRAYPIKLAVAQLAHGESVESVTQGIQHNPELLRALFRRSFDAMSPAGQYLALLIAQTGRSPALLLQVSMNRRNLPWREAELEVLRHSIVENDTLPSGLVVYSVPDAATHFLNQQLNLSSFVDSIRDDVEFVRLYKTGFSRDRRSYAMEVAREIAENVKRGGDGNEDAVSLIESLASSEPAVWGVVSRLRSDLGLSSDDQIQALKRGLEDDPSNLFLWEEWIQLEVGRGATDRAAQLVRQVLEICDSAQDRVELAMLWFDLRTSPAHFRSDAREATDRAVVSALELVRNELTIEGRLKLAWALVHVGRAQDALRVVEDALRRDRADPQLLSLQTRLLSDLRTYPPS